MGPMMDGWQGGGAVVGWIGPAVVVFMFVLFLLFAVTRVVPHGGDNRPKTRLRSTEETLRERYAKGELSRQQFHEALEEMLKDRYVRGEVTFDGFESRLDRLFGKGRSRQVARGAPSDERSSDSA